MLFLAKLKTIGIYFDCQECRYFTKGLCYNRRAAHAFSRYKYCVVFLKLTIRFNLQTIYEYRSKFYQSDR